MTNVDATHIKFNELTQVLATDDTSCTECELACLVVFV